MATPALIDLSNYADLLVRSSDSRSGTPDGNVYFDKTSGKIEFITATDCADVIYPTGHANHSDGNPEANPLTDLLGLKFEAIYAFENQERNSSLPADGSGPSLDLRQFNRWTKGTFKFGGSYSFENGRIPSIAADRSVIRGSGWNEKTGTVVNQIQFGVKGLGSIISDSQPYRQALQYGTAIDLGKLGNIDEAWQVFGDGSNGAFDDTATSAFLSIRTYGKNYDRIDTASTLGIAELGGYSTGAALNESDHLTTGSYALADVYGGSQTAPWTGMSLEKLATAQTESGFAGAATGDFTWVLNNTLGGTLDECVAYLDAIAQEDGDVTTGEAILNGKQYDTWYEYSPGGKIIPVTGAGDGLGMFIENLPAADKTSVIFYEDSEATSRDTSLEYPVYTSVSVEIGQSAIDDTNAWYHVFDLANYDSASATTYQDATPADVYGAADNSSTFITGAQTYFAFSHNYTINGSQDVVVLCEGDGGVTQAKTGFTIADSSVSQSCIPAQETNA